LHFLLDFGAPSAAALANDYEQVLYDLDKLGYNIVDYERAHENADFADLEDMIAATGSLIAAQAGKNVGDYVPGSVQESLGAWYRSYLQAPSFVIQFTVF